MQGSTSSCVKASCWMSNIQVRAEQQALSLAMLSRALHTQAPCAASLHAQLLEELPKHYHLGRHSIGPSVACHAVAACCVRSREAMSKHTPACNRRAGLNLGWLLQAAFQ